MKTNSIPLFVTAIFEDWYVARYFYVIEVMMVVFYPGLAECNDVEFVRV